MKHRLSANVRSFYHDHVAAFSHGQSKYSFAPKKGYSKNQFIAPKLLKDTKQGYTSLTDRIDS